MQYEYKNFSKTLEYLKNQKQEVKEYIGEYNLK